MSNPAVDPPGFLRRLVGLTPTIPEGFTAMTEFAAGDVFIVGYPKSGNTWFQELAAAVAFGLVPRYSPPLLVLELVPDVHYRPYYRRYATPTFFKSHHLPRPEYRRVVYLLRDGRDVMVSYYHWFNARLGQRIDFLEMVQTGKHLFPDGCKWHQHVEAWLANPFGAEMLVIRYEDLKTDTLRELERFCAFVGIQREKSFLELMAAEATFEKMREREQRLGRVNPDWPSGKFFRRRGVIGCYRDEMPAAVQTAFVADAQATLRKTGYAS